MAEDELESLCNLGPASTAWLREVGVCTKVELRRLGPVVVYKMVKQRQPKASLNLLWALAAALADKDWRNLTTDEKLSLTNELYRL